MGQKVNFICDVTDAYVLLIYHIANEINNFGTIPIGHNQTTQKVRATISNCMHSYWI